MSRVAGIIMPFACYFAIEKGDYMSPYYIFLVVGIIALIATIKLPFDTTGKALDHDEEDTVVDPYATQDEIGKVDDIQSVNTRQLDDSAASVDNDKKDQ